jgi:hypothetical protein
MALTPNEQTLDIARFMGQQGRGPVGSVLIGAAANAEGSFHDSEFLRGARGSSKLISAPLPPSGYELRGIATGILEIPAVEGYETAWNVAPGSPSKAFGISFVVQPLAVGRITSSASDDGQLLLATATQIGAHPTGGPDINSIRIGLVISGSDYALRVKWGTSLTDLALKNALSVPFDLTLPFSVYVVATQGTPNNVLDVQAYQPGPGGANTSPIAQAKDWVVHQFWLGGVLPARRPYFGVQSPCYCVISDVNLFANLAAAAAPTGWLGSQVIYATRTSVTTTSATVLLDSWRLTGVGDQPISQAGRKALVVGNRVHRDLGVTAAQAASLRFDGSGAVLLPRADRLREPPKDRASGGVEGHYLELPEYSIGMWIDPRRIPWRHPSVERACLLCWATPYAANLGVASDPDTGLYPNTTRPSEHLRVELERVGSTYHLRAYFGELEPQSLKHPTGTVGGQSSTAWPPALSTAGEPPATWNKPKGDPTGAGTRAFQVILGADGDATHPMSYGWLVFLQRKFVAQDSASNACSVFVRRYTLAGALDTVFGEVKDVNADGNGERHPLNQSCFSAARLNGNDVNFLPEQYAMALGAGPGSRLGDERKSYDGTTRLPGCYPADGADVAIEATDEVDGFPFVGRIAQPFMLRRYLHAKDRNLIATAGAFTGEIRQNFLGDVIFSLSAEEPAGSILREARGNSPAYATKYGVSVVLNDASIEVPAKIGTFPRPEPSWHGPSTTYAGEYGQVNGVAQRIDATGKEELFVIGQAGLYAYSRTSHALTRMGTLPGQGGPGQASIAIDHNDVAHIAGGLGRPVLVTRDGLVAISGIERPHYYAPSQIITAKKALTGGLTVDFQVKTDANVNNLVGYEIDDAATVQFAIGYWSDALLTRSRPGPVVTCRFVNPTTTPGTAAGAAATTKYRLLIAGLPPPRGANSSLITHWEIYRTDPNGRVLLLERRIPIADKPVSALIGDRPNLENEADFLRDIPPEGMTALVVYGDRLIGVSPPEFPRSIYYTKLRDPTAWPPTYRRNLNETPSPAVGAVVRRDRAFAFSRDHFYQVLDGRTDADLSAGVLESMDVSPLIKGCGALSHHIVISDDDNGIYVAGAKTVYLTEGGAYRSASLHNDSSDVSEPLHWSWPDSWDLSQPELFVAWHDERHRIIGICGPSEDDPDRRDAMLMFYERSSIGADGRSVPNHVEMSRLRGVNMSCAGTIIDPVSGARSTWFGTQLGYLCAMGDQASLGVDYAWLPAVSPKMGIVIDAPTTTTLRLDSSFTGLPVTDLFRGAVLRLYRDDELITTRMVLSVVVSASWVDVTLDGNHDGKIADTWTIGAIPFEWIGGKLDFGTLLQDKAVQSADLAMAD